MPAAQSGAAHDIPVPHFFNRQLQTAHSGYYGGHSRRLSTDGGYYGGATSHRRLMTSSYYGGH